MSILIVTHAFACDLPQYAVFLRAQLSSLIKHAPYVDTRVEVCYTIEDERVVKVLDDMDSYSEVSITRRPVVPSLLFRRAIGRNMAALEAKESLVWFTDVDHVFGEGCLDDLWLQWQNMSTPKPVMFYPEELMIHVDHETGDLFWMRHEESRGLIEPDLRAFMRKRYTRAIGGVQIVDGDFARRCGYLNDHPKWQKPQREGRPFGDFRDDIAFRRLCLEHGTIRPIHLKGLFRLRHTRASYQ